MKCPHCRENFHDSPQFLDLAPDIDGFWRVEVHECPACEKLVLYLELYERSRTSDGRFDNGVLERRLIRPKGSSRPPAPSNVPSEVAGDYAEACLVVVDSPKASAALSRRCLQTILREKAGATERDLARQIQTVLDSSKLPSYLADDLDAVRNIGNFAAHPIKSQHSGEVLPVEPGEAEWNLDVIEALFDFYFVAPARARARSEALNRKLDEAGKPAMKSSSP